MLLCDSTGAVPEEDVFKKNRQIVKKSIYAITEKVTDHDVAEKTDKIGDPDWRTNWKPTQKWSDAEVNFKCQGRDRQLRTFGKITEHSAAADKHDEEVKTKMEEIIVR